MEGPWIHCDAVNKAESETCYVCAEARKIVNLPTKVVKPNLKINRQHSLDSRWMSQDTADKLNDETEFKRKYLLAGSFVYLVPQLQKMTGYKEKNSFFENVESLTSGIEISVCKHCEGKQPKEGKTKCGTCGGNGRNFREAGNRFTFRFLKQFYAVIKENIDVKETKCCKYEKPVSWARGMAVLQQFDKTNDTELGPTELKQFIKQMRTKGYISEKAPSKW